MKAFLRLGLLLAPALLLGVLPASSPAQFGVSVTITTAPPMLPVYDQPPCPEEGYLWEPGYWAWGPDGYYWVPGVWIMPPDPGLVWTPGYWAFEDGDYVWNEGYWGPEVGFYGGVDYGFGYPGEGFYGGMWQNNVFVYNDAYWHVDRDRIHHVYDRREDFHENNHNRASFNGRGGVEARPTPQDERAMHARHIQPTPVQIQHRQAVARNPEYQYKNNHGKPQHPAMVRPTVAPARNQQRPAQNGRGNTRPNQQMRQQRPMTNQRPQAQPRQQYHPQQQPQRPQSRPETRPQPQTRPMPEQQRPQSRPETRPQPQSRPQPENRPAPRQERPQSRPQPQSRPMPEQQRPQSRPEPRPQPQSRPAPHPQSHPEKPHPQA